jgi:hypothetical protein
LTLTLSGTIIVDFFFPLYFFFSFFFLVVVLEFELRALPGLTWTSILLFMLPTTAGTTGLPHHDQLFSVEM